MEEVAGGLSVPGRSPTWRLPIWVCVLRGWPANQFQVGLGVRLGLRLRLVARTGGGDGGGCRGWGWGLRAWWLGVVVRLSLWLRLGEVEAGSGV